MSCTRSWLQLVWWQFLVCWQLQVVVSEANSCKHKRRYINTCLERADKHQGLQVQSCDMI